VQAFLYCGTSLIGRRIDETIHTNQRIYVFWNQMIEPLELVYLQAVASISKASIWAIL